MKLADYEVTNQLRRSLISDDRIRNLVSDKISPVIITENTDGDCVYYEKYGLSSLDNKMGVYEYSMNVAFGVVSDNSDTVNVIAWLIVEILSGKWSNMDISVSDSEEGIKDKKYIKVIEFLIKW